MSEKQKQSTQRQNQKPRPASHQLNLDPTPAELLIHGIGHFPDGAPSDLPHTSNNRLLRQTQIVELQKQRGNAFVQRFLSGKPALRLGGASGIIQRTDDDPPPANPGGFGPGSITGAEEVPYNVRGATLDDITGQLNRFGGYAAETSAPLGVEGNNINPEEQDDGTYSVTVPWVIDGATVGLPKWRNYDQACTAAQQEWDRFMGQTRQHEQEAHVDAANQLLEDLEDEDRIITGPSAQDVARQVRAKMQVIGQRIQDLHDDCDHGVGIDAILHPDNGRCETEEEEGGQGTEGTTE